MIDFLGAFGMTFSLVSALIYYYFLKSQTDDLKSKLSEHAHILKRITRDMKFEPGEFIMIGPYDEIILTNPPDGLIIEELKNENKKLREMILDTQNIIMQNSINKRNKA